MKDYHQHIIPPPPHIHTQESYWEIYITIQIAYFHAPPIFIVYYIQCDQLISMAFILINHIIQCYPIDIILEKKMSIFF